MVPISQVDSSQNPNIENQLNVLLQALTPAGPPNPAVYTGQAIVVPFTKRFRIKNLRGAIAGNAAVNGQVFASVDIQNPPSNMQLNTTTAVLGFVQQGTFFDRRSATNTGSSSGLVYAQCEDANSNLATDANSATFGGTVQPGLLLRYSEGFANSFKTRGYLPSQQVSQDQSDPTNYYATESGFYNTRWAALPNGIGRAGIADHGTRLRAAFGTVPANLRLYVTVGNVNGSATSGTGAYGVMTDASGADQSLTMTPATATSAAYGSTGSNTTFATFGNVLTPFGSNAFTGPAGSPFQGKPTTNGYVQVPVNLANAAFTWEVYSSVPYNPESFLFQVVAAWRASLSPPPGSITVQGSFAPVNSTTTASGAAVPIPRFQDASSSDPLFQIQSCATNLLSVAPASQSEGNTGTKSINVFVSLSSPAPVGGVTFNISTSNNTALAGSDYIAQSLTGQIIPEGLQNYTFTVLINGDTDSEPDETFFVTVSNVARATAGSPALGTIVNDDISLTSINTIQGTGAASPLVGQFVKTTGIVTALRDLGYFIQAPDANVDGDPNSSEGLQISTMSALPAVGDRLEVTGTVEEVPYNFGFSATRLVNTTFTVFQAATRYPLHP